MEPKKYIHDEQGKVTSVILDIEEYNAIKEKEAEITKRLPYFEQIYSLFDKSYQEASNAFKKIYLSVYLNKNKLNMSKTARAIKIHRNTIVWFARKFGLPRKIRNKKAV